MATCSLCGVEGARLYARSLCLLCKIRCSATEPVQARLADDESRLGSYRSPIVDSSQLVCVTDSAGRTVNQFVHLQHQPLPERARAAVDRTCGRTMEYYHLFVDQSLQNPY